KEKRLNSLLEEIRRLETLVSAMVVKDNKEKAERLQTLQAELTALEERIARIKDQERRLGELERDLDLQAQSSLASFQSLRAELVELGIAPGDLGEFQMKFAGEYGPLITARQSALAAEVALLTNGSQPSDPSARPLTL